MFRALYDFGMSHPDAVLPAGCARRTLKFVVDFDSSGGFVGVRSSDYSKVVCPDVVGAGRGSGTKCNAFVEKASISISMPDDSVSSDEQAARLDGKRDCFRGYLRDGRVVEPALGLVLDALETPVVLDAILDAAVAVGVTAGDAVGFAVDGTLVSGLRTVLDWWADRVLDSGGAVPTAIDVVTGEPCVPTRLFKPISVSAAGGGQSSGVSLVSFNERAFESYGQYKWQGANCPMSQRTADVVMDSVEYLGARAPRVAGMKFLHWYDRDVSDVDDVVGGVFFGGFLDGDEEGSDDVSSGAMDAAATRLVRSPLSGQVPASLVGSKYHILVLKPEMARMSVRFYGCGAYEELYESLSAWFGDMSLVDARGTGMLPSRSFSALSYGLLTASELERSGDKKFAGLQAAMPALWRACLSGGPLPDVVVGRALARVRSDIYSKGRVGGVPIQVIKMWLLRRPGGREGGNVLMPDVSSGIDRVSYHCGRLMAIYARLQETANRDANTTVLTQYYASCSQSPAVVLGRLQNLSVHHFRKIKSPSVARVYSDALSEVWSRVGSEIPARMSVTEQAYFAAGYWQECAELSRRMASRGASSVGVESDVEEEFENE